MGEIKIIRSKKAENKTVAVKLRFWTNNMKLETDGKPAIACWDCGVMDIEANTGKGIQSINPVPFNSLEDIIPLIQEIFREQHIFMVSACRRPRVLNADRKS